MEKLYQYFAEQFRATEDLYLAIFLVEIFVILTR